MARRDTSGFASAAALGARAGRVLQRCRSGRRWRRCSSRSLALVLFVGRALGWAAGARDVRHDARRHRRGAARRRAPSCADMGRCPRSDDRARAPAARRRALPERAAESTPGAARCYVRCPPAANASDGAEVMSARARAALSSTTTTCCERAGRRAGRVRWTSEQRTTPTRNRARRRAQRSARGHDPDRDHDRGRDHGAGRDRRGHRGHPAAAEGARCSTQRATPRPCAARSSCTWHEQRRVRDHGAAAQDKSLDKAKTTKDAWDHDFTHRVRRDGAQCVGGSRRADRDRRRHQVR